MEKKKDSAQPVSAPDAPDSRLTLAFELLQSVLEQSSDGLEQARTSVPMPFFPSSGQGERMSATDLLNWWFRPQLNTINPWDDYFDQTWQPNSDTLAQTAEQLRPAEDKVTSLWDDPIDPWTNLWELVSEPEEPSDEHAEAAVECLYDFIHAIGRCDINAALKCIADDYHVFTEDREIDRQALRHQIESLLDSLRGWEFQISLAEIPVPIFHPNHILIYAEFQIEAHQLQDDLHRFIVEHRIVVFEQQAERNWLISALSPVREIMR